ncbi:bifunctional UDP-N-acetylmuramoyl-tripeptide:D-alanyl-D-alanine ligase/alanine racemase [Ferruginibacter lapsinanis]|uniref:bifunctional UDP-N-acetylmuramoyl-tripeptide:D-alanyl-D-alanine ligase/alanine racemase n=1 Tax=Ferruginibacter lapsinanis TaxID=563172 RepID=UPI001E4838AA|nr:bifunctional UDP-N-acetylmuramoyl-tripeptide:D-alanyl-D-alanine ligase/alanine racemase [Ferruginibacter lapsinanis]UEG51196.1 bifunctional UDP-N-acetylmuramoyl-tripeptide:D-alanyl-D-alanine ligase/alanine racemase [Ferruginibacter lapsinanis]
MYTTSSIAGIIKANWLQQSSDATIEHILLDSRKLLFPDKTLFFALNGERRNGSLFIRELYDKGVMNFVVEEDFSENAIINFPGANFLQVKNALQALHLLTAYHRKAFNIPVIGITGSNGKTIVKEWLYQLLHDEYTIVRNPKSYNSQIGVPLSVWQINSQHTLGIFEAGISQPDEMQRLEKIIEPTIGIFTNIGQAHSEGFLNIRQKINEKLKLFINTGVLIYCADNPDVNEAITTFATNVRNGDAFTLFSWSKKNQATLQILSVEKNEDQTLVTANYQEAVINCVIPFVDDASIENAINCWCVLLYLKIGHQLIAERMLHLRNVEMRLELKQGMNNCSIINDSYSADINSLTIALDFLSQQQQHSSRTLILSDILQSGKNVKDLYSDIAAILQQKNINRLIGIGPEISKQKEVFKNIPNCFFFSSTNDFKQQFHSLHFYNETILLKGARVFEFEQISHLLEQKVHQTVLEINLNAVTHNLKEYQQQLNPGVKLMAMVKAFSYGSGGFEIANLLQFHKVDYLAVAYADEGVELRKAGITLPIMVMNAEETTFDVLVQYNLEPELFSFNMLSLFQDYLEKSGISYYPVHIKIDTGMHRLGFEQQDMERLAIVLATSSIFKVQSVFSHLAASDSASHDDFTQLQFRSFMQCCDLLKSKIGYSFLCHIANTSAIHRHKEMQLDMVRLGIGLYGVDNNSSMQQRLKNVTTLKTTISQIKKVKAGESVGYSRKGVAVKDSAIATVRIGYADGYPRALSNGVGKMWVGGSLVPVIGNVCMDMTMLDITGLNVEEGDDVVVFGEVLSVNDLSVWADTIPYEILTGISQRVKRVYYEE